MSRAFVSGSHAVGITVVLFSSALSVAPTGQQGATGEWRRPGGDAGFTRYSSLDQITKDNVSRLSIAWRRPSVDPSLTAGVSNFSYAHDFRATPLMIDGVLYSSNGIGLVEAFHPGTGKTLWVQRPYADEPERGLRGLPTRGLGYWSEGATRRLFVIRGEYLIALDLATGTPVASWGQNGRLNLKVGLGPRATDYQSSSGPYVCRDVVMAGSQMTDRPQSKEQPPGDVQAFDVRTGKPRGRTA